MEEGAASSADQGMNSSTHGLNLLGSVCQEMRGTSQTSRISSRRTTTLGPGLLLVESIFQRMREAPQPF